MPAASITLVGGVLRDAGADFLDDFAFDQDVGRDGVRRR